MFVNFPGLFAFALTILFLVLAAYSAFHAWRLQ